MARKSLDDLPRHNCLAFNLQGGQNRGWYFRRNGKLVTVQNQQSASEYALVFLHTLTGQSPVSDR